MARKRKQQEAQKPMLPQLPLVLRVSDDVLADLRAIPTSRPRMAQLAMAAARAFAKDGDTLLPDGRSAVKHWRDGPLAGHWRIAVDDETGGEQYRVAMTLLPAERAVEVWYVGPWSETYVARGALARLRRRLKRSSRR
jgi:hypothetical protein